MDRDIMVVSSNNQISPERAFQFTAQADAASIEHLIAALARKRAELYGWDKPERKQGQSDEDYKRVLEASVFELTGSTLANLIMSATEYVAVWAQGIVSRGLTLVPEFLADDESRGLDVPLRRWFDQCNLIYAIHPSVISRVISFLTEVVPVIRRHAKVDESVITLLVNEDRGMSFPRKCRMALDVIREDRKTNGGVVRPETAKLLAKHLSLPTRDPGEMEKDLASAGMAPAYVKRTAMIIPAGAFVVNRTDLDTGEIHKGMDYLIQATGEAEIEFVDDFLARGPFEVRMDLGKEADGAWRKYVSINKDQSNKE